MDMAATAGLKAGMAPAGLHPIPNGKNIWLAKTVYLHLDFGSIF